MKVNIHEAKTQLSRLIERALKGEEVTIAKAGHPVFRLTPIQVEKPILGSARGLVSMQPGWDQAMTPEEVEETFWLVRLLLDTHAFLFAIAEPESLSAKTRRLLANPDIERWVSVVSLWEIAVKIQIGKLAMPLEGAFYLRHLQALKAQTLAVSLQHSLAVLGLPPPHRDTFDRLLIAQANEEGLTLVSRDEAFRAYDVARLW